MAGDRNEVKPQKWACTSVHHQIAKEDLSLPERPSRPVLPGFEGARTAPPPGPGCPAGPCRLTQPPSLFPLTAFRSQAAVRPRQPHSNLPPSVIPAQAGIHYLKTPVTFSIAAHLGPWIPAQGRNGQACDVECGCPGIALGLHPARRRQIAPQ